MHRYTSMGTTYADDFMTMPMNDHSDYTESVDVTDSLPVGEDESRLPLVSRKAVCKKRIAMQANDRLRKSRDQVTYLTRLYQMTGGKLDRK